uniref:Uncharacterized protein n=1 Tax=Siphoviridae sp. ctFSL3 TaxID=2825404 RepID=A0A8S5PDH6_9CAUD|nr:MAG TPA: hypothetical protein [Siphoviridae sp. ctFSL3]
MNKASRKPRSLFSCQSNKNKKAFRKLITNCINRWQLLTKG